MTGFGRSEYRAPHGPVRIEIKSTNLKFFELNPRLPEALTAYAEPIRKLVQRHVRRGKILLSVIGPETLWSSSVPHLDEKLAKAYYRILKRLDKVLGTGEKITLRHVLRMPDVITRSVSASAASETWQGMRKAIEKAVEEFDRSRLREGAALARDMQKRARSIQKEVAHIRKRAPQVVARYRLKAGRRLKAESDPDGSRERLAAETAAFAKSADITEEIVRLDSHLKAFLEALKGSGEAGRRIDFIAQEMAREANTMGAKANDFSIAGRVIHIKSEVEKIREQGQNVE